MLDSRANLNLSISTFDGRPMAKWRKTLNRVLSGTSDANIGFRDLCELLERLGFTERVRGDHHIFTRDGISEILNIQPNGTVAKAYQVRQIRNVIINYQLAGEADNHAQ